MLQAMLKEEQDKTTLFMQCIIRLADRNPAE
jgi:hypothetical protein